MFHRQEVEYLGLIIKPNYIATDPTKLKGILEWPLSKKPKDIHRFLGFCGFYRKFIQGYSQITRPLEKLKQVKAVWEWSKEAQQAFDTLKERFSNPSMLLVPDKTKPFILETDASLEAWGAVLRQYDHNGELKACSYLSKAFNPAKRNYQIYDRELLAIVQALKTWRHYLLGTPHPVTI